MTDNGAKALAERLPYGESVVSRTPFANNLGLYEAMADAILANGAVFLTAEEAERLRRIETAARAFMDRPGSETAERATLRAALTEPSHD